jgi:hypothetical protein
MTLTNPKAPEGELEEDHLLLITSEVNKLVANATDDSGTDSDSSDNTKPRERHSKNLKAYDEARKHFRRDGGIIYAANDLWGKYYLYCINSHIYVSSASSMSPDPRIRASEPRIHSGSGATELRSPSPKLPQSPPQLLTNGTGVGVDVRRSKIPCRLE